MNAPSWIADRHWEALGWTMIHFLWVGALLHLAGALGGRLLRARRPELRYAFQLGVLALLTAAPILLFALVAGGAPPAAEAAPATAPPVTASPVPVTAAARPEPAGAAGIATALAAAAGHLPWAWLAGVALTSAWWMLGFVGLARLRRRRTPVPWGPAVRRLEELRQALGIARRVGLAVSRELRSPIVAGVLRPLILVPPSLLLGCTPRQLEMVLLHELAHVRRHDNLVNLLQRLVETLLFFHPSVWAVSRRVRREREHCCDAVVLEHHEPRGYAETLVGLAASPRAIAGAAAAMAEHDLVVRVRRILNLEERPVMNPSKTLVGALGTGLALAVLVVSGFAQRPTPPTPEKPKGAPEAGPAHGHEHGHPDKPSLVPHPPAPPHRHAPHPHRPDAAPVPPSLYAAPTPVPDPAPGTYRRGPLPPSPRLTPPPGHPDFRYQTGEKGLRYQDHGHCFHCHRQSDARNFYAPSLQTPRPPGTPGSFLRYHRGVPDPSGPTHDADAGLEKLLQRALKQLEETRREIEELRKRLDAREGRPPRGRRIGRLTPDRTDARAITGRILSVDAGARSLVLDRGARHGVDAGMRFEVARGRDYLGRLEIVSTDDTTSVAAPLLGRLQTFRGGDLVTTRLR